MTYGDHHSSRVAIHVNPDGSVAVDAHAGHSDGCIKQAVQKRARGGHHVIAAPDPTPMSVDKTVAVVRLKGNRLEVQSASGGSEGIKGRIRAW